MFTLKTDVSMFKKNQQNKRYKVLLNAGGGVYGYIITYLMSQLEQDIYAKIDVAAGTSIGGILTLLYSVNNDKTSLISIILFKNSELMYNYYYKNKLLQLSIHSEREAL